MEEKTGQIFKAGQVLNSGAVILKMSDNSCNLPYEVLFKENKILWFDYLKLRSNFAGDYLHECVKAEYLTLHVFKIIEKITKLSKSRWWIINSTAHGNQNISHALEKLFGPNYERAATILEESGITLEHVNNAFNMMHIETFITLE